MITYVYVTYDSKAGLYSRPFYAPKRGIALRTFQDIAGDKEHPISRHPADYTLFEIAEFDDLKGVVEMYESKVSLGTAQEMLIKE